MLLRALKVILFPVSLVQSGVLSLILDLKIVAYLLYLSRPLGMINPIESKSDDVKNDYLLCVVPFLGMMNPIENRNDDVKNDDLLYLVSVLGMINPIENPNDVYYPTLP